MGNDPSDRGWVVSRQVALSVAFKAHKAAELQSLKPLQQFLL